MAYIAFDDVSAGEDVALLDPSYQCGASGTHRSLWDLKRIQLALTHLLLLLTAVDIDPLGSEGRLGEHPSPVEWAGATRPSPLRQIKFEGE